MTIDGGGIMDEGTGRRRGWLRWLELVLSTGTIVLTVFGASFVVAAATGTPVCTRVFGGAVALDGLRPGATAGSLATACISKPDRGQSLLGYLDGGPAIVVAVIVAGLLLQIVRDARAGNPLTPTTVRRLRAAAVVVLVGGLVAVGAATVASDVLAAAMVEGGVAPNGSAWPWLLAGIGLFAIAEVVKRGQEYLAPAPTPS